MCLFSSGLSYTLHHHHSQLLQTLIYFHCCEDAASFGGMRTEALRDPGLDGVCLQGQLNLLTLEKHTQVCCHHCSHLFHLRLLSEYICLQGKKELPREHETHVNVFQWLVFAVINRKKSKDDSRITRLQVVPVHNRQCVPKALSGASCCYRLRRTHQRIFSHPDMVHRFCFPRTEPMWEDLSSSLTHWLLLSCSCLQPGPTSRRSAPSIEQLCHLVLGRVSPGCPQGPSPSAHFPEVMSWKKKTSFYRKLCKGATEVLWFCLCIPKYTTFFLILYDLHLPYKNKLSAGE